MAEHTFWVEPEYEGYRVETYLRRIKGMSRRTMVTLRHRENGITCNAKPIRTVDILRAGDRLTLLLTDERPPQAASLLPVDIVYEDEDYFVCNKPAGMPVHPSLKYYENTLANAVSALYAGRGEAMVFRPLNRLDRGTSGLVLAAKHQFAASLLKGGVEKEYFAVAEGALRGSGWISAPLRRRDETGCRQIVHPEGARAVTHWKAISCEGGVTQLRIRLETGRTHQIRAHMSFLGVPLAGDAMYGGSTERLSRQALHCGFMRFRNPLSGAGAALSVPLPGDIASFLEAGGIVPHYPF